MAARCSLKAILDQVFNCLNCSSRTGLRTGTKAGFYYVGMEAGMIVPQFFGTVKALIKSTEYNDLDTPFFTISGSKFEVAKPKVTIHALIKVCRGPTDH